MSQKETNVQDIPTGGVPPDSLSSEDLKDVVVPDRLHMFEVEQLDVTKQLANPDSPLSKSAAILNGRLASIFRLGLDLLDEGELTIQKTEDLAEFGLSIFEARFEQADNENDGIRHIGPAFHYEDISTSLFRLFSEIDKERPATPAEDVRRTKVLLRVGTFQETTHKLFTDKYIDVLTGKSDEIIPEVSAIWQNPDFLDGIGVRIEGYASKYAGFTYNWPVAEQELVVKAFESLGFTEDETEEIITALESFADVQDTSDHNVIIRNLANTIMNLSSLMSAGAEVPHKIYERFGIRNFHRYKPEHLYKQLKYFEAVDRGEVDDPSSLRLVVTATDDWNGAFQRPDHIYGNLNPVYMEASTLGQVARAMIKTRKVGLISSLIVAGHGEIDHIVMSESEDGLITQADLERSRGLKRIKSKRYFTDDAEIILNSCSTGKPGGIAESISNVASMHVLAPDDAASMRIEKDKDQKRRHMVKFTIGKTVHDDSIEKASVGVAYKSGKKHEVESVDLHD